jgi:ribonucleoside-diphosphate reductase alpha chain
MSRAGFSCALSADIWESKYRYLDGVVPEETVADSWARVARALSKHEDASEIWENRFRDILDAFRFLPGGRILAGAGTHHRATLCNCFVMGFIRDSMDDIFERLKESALTMQWGGGIGCDFSTLRPRGSLALQRNTTASGPVSFMTIWDATCAALMSTGSRRGAMMGTLRCDHPDVLEFIDAKRVAGELTNFNLSLQITDEFMTALSENEEWPLCFPGAEGSKTDSRLLQWPGADRKIRCRIFERVPARKIWAATMSAAYDSAEPGVLFVDQINRYNNLHYREHITTTNPCGEIPLPPYGACVLGSLNLTAFVRFAFSRRASLDLPEIERVAMTATRLLDNVVDCSGFPLAAQQAQAAGARRVGLGITGLADALIMLGHRYDTDAAREIARSVVERVRDAAYLASTQLAEEKGSFPYFDRDAYLDGEYAKTLPVTIRDAIARRGIRNSHLLAIAPTGTISLLANNISSGIEPVFAMQGQRRMVNRSGELEVRNATDHAYRLWREFAGRDAALPSTFVTAREITPDAHLQMQAALQPLVDNSISKTINVPESISKDDFETIYLKAYELRLKGCTVFRDNPVRGRILSDQNEAMIPGCPLER